jgi:hypothetical protein
LEAGMEANEIRGLERKSPNIRSTFFSKFTCVEKIEMVYERELGLKNNFGKISIRRVKILLFAKTM